MFVKNIGSINYVHVNIKALQQKHDDKTSKTIENVWCWIKESSSGGKKGFDAYKMYQGDLSIGKVFALVVKNKTYELKGDFVLGLTDQQRQSFFDKQKILQNSSVLVDHCAKRKKEAEQKAKADKSWLPSWLAAGGGMDAFWLTGMFGFIVILFTCVGIGLLSTRFKKEFSAFGDKIRALVVRG